MAAPMLHTPEFVKDVTSPLSENLNLLGIKDSETDRAGRATRHVNVLTARLRALGRGFGVTHSAAG